MEKAVTNGLAALWAGVSLGGAIIAAPAKFQAQSLTLPVALDVGRAQFFWVGAGEVVICLAFLVSLYRLRRLKWYIPAIPILAFTIQRILIMPSLDERTLQIIAGQPVEPSSLHLVFVVLEIIKCLILAIIGLGIVEICYGAKAKH